ncbi:MAG: DUF924 family protein [Pseudomonadota bacterium]
MSEIASPFDVLEFWWKAGPQKWWSTSEHFDRSVRDRFGATHEAAVAGELDEWAENPHGALALIVLLDQFTRNLNRQSSAAFGQDDRALAVARAAVDKGFDRAFPAIARSFFYLPFMHAEDMAAQEACVDHCRQHGDPDNYRASLEHMDIIRRFGRFPHRNKVLGRKTTDAERRFLETGGFKG